MWVFVCVLAFSYIVRTNLLWHWYTEHTFQVAPLSFLTCLYLFLHKVPFLSLKYDAFQLLFSPSGRQKVKVFPTIIHSIQAPFLSLTFLHFCFNFLSITCPTTLLPLTFLLLTLGHGVSWFLLAPCGSPFPSSQAQLDDWIPCWGVVVVVGPGRFSRGSFTMSVFLECPHFPTPTLPSHTPPLPHNGAVSSQTACFGAQSPYLRPRSCLRVTIPETARAPWKTGCRQPFRSPEKTQKKAGLQKVMGIKLKCSVCKELR